MKKLFAFLFSMAIAMASMAQNPTMFLTPEKVANLKTLIVVDGSHHKRLFDEIKKRCDNNDINGFGTEPPNYLRSFMAVQNALVYLLTDDNKYSTQAYNALTQMYSSGEEGTPTIPDLGTWPPNATPGSKALTYVFPGMAYSICHNWLKDSWSTEQQSYILDSLKAGLDDWSELFRWELYDMPNSNWVSVCRGAEIVMMLGINEHLNRPDQYRTIKDSLRRYYELAHSAKGYSLEGLGYMHYGLPFSIAAIYAMQETGDTTLNVCLREHEFQEIYMYASSFTANRYAHMTGVDNSGVAGEGLYGLLLNYPYTKNPEYYKYFYDHFIGTESVLSDSLRFDQRRFGAVWNFIYYPANLQKVNPTQNLDIDFADEDYGVFMFRNQWNDENDILFNIQGRSVYHKKGWQDAETFNTNLIAYNTRFWGGAGKTNDKNNYSSLLIDGKASQNSKDSGAVEVYEQLANGGYVILDGAQKYSNLGLSSAKRHCRVEMFDDNTAFISTIDFLTSITAHTYRYQLNVGNEKDNDGVIITTGIENNHPYFLLSGKNNSYVKGWCVNFIEAAFEGTDPLYIEIPNAKDQQIWIAMIVGQGTPPNASFSGIEMDNEITINSLTASFNNTSNRIETKTVTYLNSFTGSGENNFYPNPAKDYIIFTSKIQEIKITDLSGKTILINSPAINQPLYIGHLQQGLYIIEYTTNGKTKYERLLKK